jgi:hypothetical protein
LDTPLQTSRLETGGFLAGGVIIPLRCWAHRSDESSRMKTTTKKQPKASTRRHPEYGTIGQDVDLGIAMLIAETEDGQYQPAGPVATINEAIECASHDMACRMRDLELGGEPTCPAIYRSGPPITKASTLSCTRWTLQR